MIRLATKLLELMRSDGFFERIETAMKNLWFPAVLGTFVYAFLNRLFDLRIDELSDLPALLGSQDDSGFLAAREVEEIQNALAGRKLYLVEPVRGDELIAVGAVFEYDEARLALRGRAVSRPRAGSGHGSGHDGQRGPVRPGLRRLLRVRRRGQPGLDARARLEPVEGRPGRGGGREGPTPRREALPALLPCASRSGSTLISVAARAGQPNQPPASPPVGRQVHPDRTASSWT